MSEPTVIAPGAGEIVGDSPDRRVEILSDHDALHATWSRFGPGRAGADLHVHRRHTDLFYVLAGELTVCARHEGEEVLVPAGTLARVPPLVVHGFRNAGDVELRYLNFHAPGVRLRRLHARAARRPRTRLRPGASARGRRPPATEAVVGGAASATARGAARGHRGDRGRGACERSRRPAPPPHRHGDHVESFYVLEGR